MAHDTLNSSAPHIKNATTISHDLEDWGDQPDMLEGQSHSSGVLLWANEDASSESAMWICTPGTWRLSIPSDELCYFVSGRATYTSDDG
ncbi:MAG: DUF861 domain-containing protein, partial [Rhodospirillales bacterium]|nr:DUF861 domain-containing protein [Rhodospirillales bacterium]